MSTQRGLPEQHYYYHNNQQVAGVSAPEAEVYRRINHKENGEPCEIRLPRVVSSRRPEPSVRRRQFDTFGESAIERIYDEFRFLDLDECHSPSSNSERPILRNDERTVTKKKGRRISAWVAAYCVLPAVQFVVSGAFLAFAIYRYYDLFKDRQISNIFLDLGKPEDFAGSPEEGAQIIQVRTGTAILIPALLQLIGALCGFWPLYKNRIAFQILHIVFSCLSVLLWFSALNTSAVELNLQYVQIHQSENSSDQLIFVILICLAYFEVLLLPTITICLSSINLLVPKRHGKGAILTVSLSIATVLLAATILVFSIYATSRSMWNIHDWPSTNIVNPGALYGFGLIESIIAGYILICSFVSFLSSTMRSTHLSTAALILQGLSTVSICMYILSPDRILSVSHNAQVQSTERKPFPVNHVVMILLYSLVLALLVSLLMQIFATIMIITKPERSTQESDEETNTTQQTLF